MRKLRVLLIFVLLSLTMWLRLRHLGHTEMWWDQSITLNRSLEWIQGGSLPLSSMQSSFGVFNPPLAQYLYAIPLFFTRNITGVVWFIGVFNSLAILLASSAIGRVFGFKLAWWVGILFAVCPWAVFFSRLIWMQSFVPGFAALLFACVLLYFSEYSDPKYLLGGALCLAAAVQTHLTAVTLIPVLIILFFLVGKANFSVKRILSGCGVFALTFLPFLVFQFQTGFADWHTLRTKLHIPISVDTQSFRWPVTLIQSRGVYPGLAFENSITPWPPLRTVGIHIDALSAALLYIGVGYGIIFVIRQWKQPAKRNLVVGVLTALLWLGVPPLFFIRHTAPVLHYYFLYTYPAQFLLMVFWVSQISALLLQRAKALPQLWKRRLMCTGANIPFVFLLLVILQQTSLNVLGQDMLSDGSIPQFQVKLVQQVIDSARTVTRRYPDCQFVVMGEGTIYETSRFGLLREFVGRDRVRFADASVRLYPVPCAIYFVLDSGEN